MTDDGYYEVELQESMQEHFQDVLQYSTLHTPNTPKTSNLCTIVRVRVRVRVIKVRVRILGNQSNLTILFWYDLSRFLTLFVLARVLDDFGQAWQQWI